MDSQHILAQHPASMADVLDLYNYESLGTRLFVYARHLLAPLFEISTYIPHQEGAILDIGCGHGLFTALLAVTRKNINILGIDPSIEKIQVAERMSHSLPNASFCIGTVDSLISEVSFQAITIVDVLLLLPYEKKLQMLKKCRQLIGQNGVLLLKTNDTHPAWKFAITRTQEWFMTKSRLTMGSDGLHILSCDRNLELLRAAGFKAKVIHLRHWSPYPHTLFIAYPA
jgi:2-polyprenyl-6-hydroxyphenyl methylase/3-demethylubiquinone-9 3-methyltransferase